MKAPGPDGSRAITRGLVNLRGSHEQVSGECDALSASLGICIAATFRTSPREPGAILIDSTHLGHNFPWNRVGFTLKMGPKFSVTLLLSAELPQTRPGVVILDVLRTSHSFENKITG